MEPTDGVMDRVWGGGGASKAVWRDEMGEGRDLCVEHFELAVSWDFPAENRSGGFRREVRTGGKFGASVNRME